MKFITITKFFIFVLSLICQWFVLSQVISRTVNNLGLVLWILSLLLLYFSFPFRFKKETASKMQNISFVIAKVDFSAILIIFLALMMRIVLMANTHVFHNDEYISSYFSYSIGNISKLDWFGAYPIPHDWIWKFPLLYFLLQKIFFNIFGLGTLMMRLSITPYIIIIFSMLFLIVKRLFSKEAAYLAILILAFFAPDLYLSRWALHFISSTAFFLTATYLFILCIEAGKKVQFGLFGFFLGTCYMTYYSSYLAAPLVLFYLLALLIGKKIKKDVLINFLLAAGIFIYTISPLVTYGIKVDNLLFQRVEQVKIINGTWSPNRDMEIISKPALEALKKQAVLSIQSLYADGIGGHGGYNFGDLALFNRTTLLFTVVSVLYFFYKIIRKKDINSLFVIMTIFATFIAGMIFTTPPPAFHRVSLIFPLVCLIVAVTIIDIFKLIRVRRKTIAFYFLVLTVLVIIVSNVIQFNKILAKDDPDDPDYPQILQYLEQDHQKKFYVAAFDTYGMGGILFIMSGGTISSVTHQLPEILTMVPKDTSSFVVILYPNEEKIRKLKAVFPDAVIINTYKTHILLRTN